MNERWNSLDDDQQGGLIIVAVLSAISGVTGGVLTTVNLATDWNASWTLVTLPVYGPPVLIATIAMYYKIMRRLVR